MGKWKGKGNLGLRETKKEARLPKSRCPSRSPLKRLSCASASQTAFPTARASLYTQQSVLHTVASSNVEHSLLANPPPSPPPSSYPSLPLILYLTQLLPPPCLSFKLYTLPSNVRSRSPKKGVSKSPSN